MSYNVYYSRTFIKLNVKRMTNEGTLPSIKSLLDRLYAQTIDLNELLNTLA
jgi:hypothetical protein